MQVTKHKFDNDSIRFNIYDVNFGCLTLSSVYLDFNKEGDYISGTFKENSDSYKLALKLIGK